MSEWRSDKFPQSQKEYRVAIVVADFNKEYGEALLKNTRDGLIQCKVLQKNIKILHVPGSFELAFGAKKAAESGNFDAIIALGVIIRGETIHFELVAESAAKGIMDVNMQLNIPVIFGVLACENKDQVEKRIELGAEFAKSAIQMIHVNSTKKGE